MDTNGNIAQASVNSTGGRKALRVRFGRIKNSLGSQLDIFPRLHGLVIDDKSAHYRRHIKFSMHDILYCDHLQYHVDLI